VFQQSNAKPYARPVSILIRREMPAIRMIVVMMGSAILGPAVMTTATARIVTGDVASVRVIKEVAGQDFAKHFK